MIRPNPLSSYFGGNISPYVALARLALEGRRAAEIEIMLRSHHGPPALMIRRILRERFSDIDVLAREAGRTMHRGCTPLSAYDAIASISASFNRSVRRNPEASVAAYSLGDPEILAAATREIVSWLNAKHLLHRNNTVLDLGCGFGRVSAALASEGHAVLGLDVSRHMIGEARRRYGNLPGLRFELTSGSNLDVLANSRFDLVLAVDSFPYLVIAGTEVVEQHFDGAHRCLQSGGAFAVLNFSYRDDPVADAEDVSRLAERHGFQLTACGETPFTLWDGRAFVLRT